MRCIILKVTRYRIPHAVLNQRITNSIVHIIVDGTELSNAIRNTFLQLARYLDFLCRDIVRSRTRLAFQHHLHKRTFLLVKIQFCHAFSKCINVIRFICNILVYRLKERFIQLFSLGTMGFVKNIITVAFHCFAAVCCRKLFVCGKFSNLIRHFFRI